MFLPYKADVQVRSNPQMNYVLIGLTCLIFIFIRFDMASPEYLVLRSFNSNLLSYGFLHAGWLHLIGNMFYLWVFGNAVCSVVGNAYYPALYLLLIIFSGIFHLIFSGDPVVGASGAVNGIIGFYVFLFPASNIKCAWLNIFYSRADLHIRAYLLIGFWFLLDIIGAYLNRGPIAHMAHIGGFLAGIAVAFLMYKYGWIKPIKNETNIVQLFEK